MITHIVLFRLKDRSPGNIEKTAGILGGLKDKVPQIRSLDIGVDLLRSARSYDVSLTARFDTMADLQAYQTHPEHKVVVDYIDSVKDSIAVVDYES